MSAPISCPTRMMLRLGSSAPGTATPGLENGALKQDATT